MKHGQSESLSSARQGFIVPPTAATMILRILSADACRFTSTYIYAGAVGLAAQAYQLIGLLNTNIEKKMPTPQNFADLLQQAEQLTADIDAGEELPRVRRNLQQIAEAGQRLLDKTSGVLDEGTDVKA